MDRRSFFERLVTAGALAVVPSLSVNGDPHVTWPDQDHPVVLGRHNVFWRGWGALTTPSCLVGFWLAWPNWDAYRQLDEHERDPVYFYMSVPALIGGVYAPGHSFSIVQRGGRR